MYRILIVEDDTETGQLFSRVLIKNGFMTRTVGNGREALDALSQDYFDLIISDVMMPVMDGYEMVTSLRQANINTPVLMITAKSEFDDMRQGFLAGSDDFMVKPINVNEMVLRVRALLRRVEISTERLVVIGETRMEYDTLTVSTGRESVTLPQKEFMVLFKLASFPGKIFTKQQIMDEIWGYSSESDYHTVEVHIGRLRDRFRDNPDFRIVTIRGLGYKLEKQAKAG